MQEVQHHEMSKVREYGSCIFSLRQQGLLLQTMHPLRPDDGQGKQPAGSTDADQGRRTGIPAAVSSDTGTERGIPCLCIRHCTASERTDQGSVRCRQDGADRRIHFGCPAAGKEGLLCHCEKTGCPGAGPETFRDLSTYPGYCRLRRSYTDH